MSARMSVDRAARDELARLLGELASGAISNDAFEDHLPASEDPAIAALADEAWHFYDDLREHTLTGDWSLSAADRQLVARMRRFLATDHAYYRSRPLLLDLAGFLLGPISFGILPRAIERWRLGRTGIEAWPFHPDPPGAT